MKTIISIIIITLCSLSLNAQINTDTPSYGKYQYESNVRSDAPSKFSMSTEVAQGFKFDNYQNPQWYTASITVTPTFNISDKLFVSEITMAIFSDGLTDYYAGGGVAYKIFEKKNLTYNVQLMASALIGTRDNQLYGGGIKLESGDFFLTVTGRQEYSNKLFYFSGGFGINLF